MADLLSDEEIETRLAQLDGWARDGDAITKKFDRGDFVLVAGTHFNSRLIRFGQKLRIHGSDRRHLRWTHAALIVDRDGSLIEAVGTGVRRWHLDRYHQDNQQWRSEWCSSRRRGRCSWRGGRRSRGRALLICDVPLKCVAARSPDQNGSE